MIWASAMGMTADDVAVGILSLVGVHPAVAKADTEVLLVECSQQEPDLFARELQAHRLAQLPPGPRVDEASDHPETTHTLGRSIANAGSLHIKFLGTCPAEGAMRESRAPAAGEGCGRAGRCRPRLQARSCPERVARERGGLKQARGAS